MLLQRKSVTSSLEAHQTWLEKQVVKVNGKAVTKVKANRSIKRLERDSERAVDLSCACLDILELCHPSSIALDKWLDRVAGRRTSLDQIETRYNKPAGNRHLKALVTVTIEVLKALVRTRLIDASCLPMPRSSSGSNLDAANAAKQARKNEIENRANLLLDGGNV